MINLTLSMASGAERPDAGAIMEGIKEQPQLPRKDESIIKILESPPRPAIKPAPGLKIRVNGFRITGNSAYTEDKLLSLLSEYTGRELSFPDLEKAANVISAYYRKRGYFLSRAYLPAQEIRDGIVEIAVLEGKIGKVEIKGAEKTRLSEATARRAIKGSIREGKPVHEDRLERGMLLLNDLPGIDVQSTLKPGATVGTTDLLVELKERFPLSVTIDADNYGNRYTGYYRGGATIIANNPAGIGESISVRGMTSGNGFWYGRAGLTLPVGSWGTRLGLAYSAMNYKLGDDFEQLNAKGSAQVASVYLLHPFIRSRKFNLYGHVEYDLKSIEDRVDLYGRKTDKSLEVGTVALSADRKDGILGGGISNATLSGIIGHLNIKSPAAREDDSFSAMTNGSYAKVTLSISRLQQLFGNVALYAAFNGQMASHNLDSSEKFSLGGPGGIRSYPQGEASGDKGYIATGELRCTLPRLTDWMIPGDLQVYGFIDAGSVRINDDPWAGAGSNNTRNLSGSGIGFNWVTGIFSLRASYAWKLGSENATSDVDRYGRFWIQTALWF